MRHGGLPGRAGAVRAPCLARSPPPPPPRSAAALGALPPAFAPQCTAPLTWRPGRTEPLPSGPAAAAAGHGGGAAPAPLAPHTGTRARGLPAAGGGGLGGGGLRGSCPRRRPPPQPCPASTARRGLGPRARAGEAPGPRRGGRRKVSGGPRPPPGAHPGRSRCVRFVVRTPRGIK